MKWNEKIVFTHTASKNIQRTMGKIVKKRKEIITSRQHQERKNILSERKREFFLTCKLQLDGTYCVNFFLFQTLYTLGQFTQVKSIQQQEFSFFHFSKWEQNKTKQNKKYRQQLIELNNWTMIMLLLLVVVVVVSFFFLSICGAKKINSKCVKFGVFWDPIRPTKKYYIQTNKQPK